LARIALKVDVDTLRGTVQGVPRLVDVFARRGIAATFLFSLGPDHTGWALRRVLRPGFLSKVSRTSVVRHYGYRTLMYGVLLPAPDIGRRGASAMQACRRAGHECGIHTWDHVVWQDNVRRRDAVWTRGQMARAYQRFEQVFGERPATHGAAGWQMNDDALCQIDDWGMAYASDGRGSAPYRPVVGTKPLRHVQLPTTLPTFDELVGVGGIDEDSVARKVLSLTEGARDQRRCSMAGALRGTSSCRLASCLARSMLRGCRCDRWPGAPSPGAAGNSSSHRADVARRGRAHGFPCRCGTRGWARESSGD
jgi:undecaprenyl phosphate-alpha-L-ara4FN deformylase